VKQKITSLVLAKFILTAIILLVFIYGMYWLWQRQPINEIIPEKEEQLESVQSNNITQLSVSPKNFSVVKAEIIDFAGITKPNSYVGVFTNEFHNITESDEKGNFSTKLALSEGLNLINLTTISDNLTDESSETLIYYFATEEENLDNDTIVFAGPVSSIFDNLIVVTTTEGEKKIQTSKDTLLEIPQEEELEATQSALTNIRIGDYAVALGKITEDFLDAGGLLIIREDKPQIVKKITSGIILTSVNDSLFSIRNQSSDIVEFSLAQTTEISSISESPSIEDIAKDNNTIVVYSSLDEENLANLVYILP